MALVVGACTRPVERQFRVQDDGALVGLPQQVSGGYAIEPHDVNGDGWPDLLISHHGAGAELYMNEPGPDGMRVFRVAFRFVDTIHHRPDRHDCAWGDVNQDGREDLYCAKGAHGGTEEKWNELWIQQPDGTFVDRAHAYGVEDIWGRARHPAFLNLNGDRYPDLFIGNHEPRRDGRPTPNRTFINVHGVRFKEVRVGLTGPVGSHCVQVVDVNHDGRDDLLLCGDRRLRLYVRQPDGPLFVNRAARYGVHPVLAFWARIVDVNGDGRGDLVVEQTHRLTVQLGRPDGHFGPPVYSMELEKGHGFAVGDIDGRGGPDLLAVQGCVNDRNIDDILLLNDGTGRDWTREPIPEDTPGCGDAAAAVDFNRDGKADLIVLNGNGGNDPGPDQLLTIGGGRPSRSQA